MITTHPIPCFLLACALGAQGWQLTPVQVGGGELLLFDAPAGEGKDAVQHWHVVDLAGKDGAREFLRTTANLTVHCRLDLRRVLVGHHGADEGLYVLDLAKGSARRIGDGTQAFVTVRGGDILFLGDERKDDPRLYAQPWTTAGPARRLAEAQLEHVEVGGDVALGITAGSRRLCRIDLLAGGATDLGAAPDVPHLPGTTLALAPDGKRFAVGLPDGTLRVHELDSGKLVRAWQGLPIDLSPEASRMPALEVAFDGPDVVVCSESRGPRFGRKHFVFVRRRIADGTVIDETPYESSGHRNPRPPETRAMRLFGWWSQSPGRVQRGRFECEGKRLFYAGDSQPIAVGDADAPGSAFDVTPGGAYALVHRDQGAWVVDVIDGAVRTRRRVFTGATVEWTWLSVPP